MRKGLIAAVVIAALVALAIMFWPRDVERDPEAPAMGNAASVVPAERDVADSGDAAVDLAAAPAATGKGAPETEAADPAPTPAPAGSAGTATASASGEEQPTGVPATTASIPDEEGGAEDDVLAALPPPSADIETGSTPLEPPATGAAPAVGEADEAAPLFDLVRVSPEGQAVIAGRAEPGQRIDILLDGEVIGSAEADASGAFVVVADAPPSDKPREMVLRVARESAQAEAAAALVAEEDAGAELAESEVEDAEAGGVSEADETALAALDPAEGSADPGYAYSAPVIILPSAGAGDAPVLVSPGEETVEIMQPAEAEAADRMALDRLTFETGGEVVAAGRGPGASVVRTYADGRLVAEAPVGGAGDWRSVIPRDVAEGTDLLRFDEVSAEGEVVSRLEAPFRYDEEGTVQELRSRSITIARGNNLWRIAEQHYGEGLRYSVIFGANSNLIRDPDLIYPGQVFTIPELVEAE